MLCVAEHRAWIGLDDSAQEGRFVLPSTGREPGYHNWEPQQPDDAYQRQDCVTMQSTGQWMDTFCDEEWSYTCELHYHWTL